MGKRAILQEGLQRNLIIDGHMHLTEPVELMLKTLDLAGIDRAVVCTSGVAKGEKILDLNSAREMMDRIETARRGNYDEHRIHRENMNLVEVVQTHGNRIWGFGKLDMFLPASSSLKEIDFCFNNGLKGIGELIGLHGRCQVLEPILQKCENLGGYPVFVHADYPMDEQDLEDLAGLVRLYPGTPVIIGHLGGDYWLKAIEIARTNSNVYLDCSEAVNLVALQVAVREVPERILFGSDYPWEHPEVILKRIAWLELDHSKKMGILGGNLSAMLGIVG